MKTWQLRRKGWMALTLGVIAVMAAGCAGIPVKRPTLLSGSQEVPVVVTRASGRADLSVRSFKCPEAASSSNCPTLMGTVTTAGVAATRVEVRQAVAGKNGPLVVALDKTGDDTWQVPSGTTLTTAQYDEYTRGQFYVNVDSPTHANGELRAQLTP